MTQEQINEGNKLIALSDEWKVFTTHEGVIVDNLYHGHPKHSFRFIDQMQYHSNWQWQIPVWSKMCKMKYDLSGLLTTSVLTKYDFSAYEYAVCNDNPQAGFEIIISILKRIA